MNLTVAADIVAILQVEIIQATAMFRIIRENQVGAEQDAHYVLDVGCKLRR